MTTLSLIAVYCGRGKGANEYGPGKVIGIEVGTSFCVFAKIKRGRSMIIHGPDDMGPDISSGHLSYLSHFKPLTEKPKPVTLPFEKPLVDLEKKITDGVLPSFVIRGMADETGLDFSNQIGQLENKYQQALKDLPTVLDHILNITEKWVELHGDRAGYDDPAIVTGLGSIDEKTYMFIGHQKGRNTKENIARNFGNANSTRLSESTENDEELGQGEAIAHNLRTMFGLKVPIVTVVTGEGGFSPEACAAILWKSSQAAPKAAEKLRITAQEHYRLKIADGIIPEPLGGAHDPAWTSQQIKITIVESIKELENMNTEELLQHRKLKFRSIGGFQEGIPVEPKRKRNMKPSEVNMPKAADIESEIESLKKKILEAKGPPDPITSQEIEKLKEDVDKEITNAFISMGLQEKLESVKLELSTTSQSTPTQPLNHSLKEKVDKIMQEFNHNLSRPGAYLGLKQKLEKLNLVNGLIEMEERKKKLKAEINQKIPAELKAKMELLKNAEENISKGELMDQDLIEEVEQVKEELVEVLKAANLDIVGVTKKNVVTAPPELKEKIVKVNNEIYEEIERTVSKAGISEKIEELKADIGKGSSSEDREKAAAKIKQEILATLDVEAIKEKVESLTVELGFPKASITQDTVGAENGQF
ncbi:hypothetical protein M0R45_034455 [Rubus argutus]|uniref:acetyl-CoA carboxytransferase n=1 Tax=Rubus argutus TaxID=59490 RepID=A0AAW1VTV2_RUBAR